MQKIFLDKNSGYEYNIFINLRNFNNGGKMLADKVESYLKENVNWDKFCLVLYMIEKAYNTPSRRFIKGGCVTEALAFCSNEKIPFTDGVGYDNIIKELDVQLEVRSEKAAIGTQGAIKSSLKLKNGQGHTTEFNPADNWFLLVVRSTAPYTIALVDAETAKNYSKHKGNEVVMDSGCTEYRLIHKSEKTYGGERLSEVNLERQIVEKICA
tara:strand:- start:1193 stop:1825 length:633 start_codon:yes stop_codon:yes gene_type:complete